jgi:hypothetical protein
MSVITFVQLSYGDQSEHGLRFSFTCHLSLSATPLLSLVKTELAFNTHHEAFFGYGVQEVCNPTDYSTRLGITLQLDFVESYRFHLSGSQNLSSLLFNPRFNYKAVYFSNHIYT